MLYYCQMGNPDETDNTTLESNPEASQQLDTEQIIITPEPRPGLIVRLPRQSSCCPRQ